MAMRWGLGQLASTLRSLYSAPAAAEGFSSLAHAATGTAALSSPQLRLTSLLPLCNQAPALAKRSGTRFFSAAPQPPEGSGLASSLKAETESIEEIRARIFGTHIGNGLRSGRKILRGQLLGEKLAAYYPEDIVKQDPLMINIRAERCDGWAMVVTGRC